MGPQRFLPHVKINYNTLISSCLYGFFERLQSFPSSLHACKCILSSLSSLLSCYLLPCKAILLVPARQVAYLTVTQEQIIPSYFPATSYILEDLSCLHPASSSLNWQSQFFGTHRRGHGFRPPTIPCTPSCVLSRWPIFLIYFNGCSPSQ